MTLRLDWKKKLVTNTERVKAVDLHSSETWVLSALYNGQLAIYDYSTQSLIKSIETSTLPLRAGKFIERENWAICGGDDLQIRVYDYLTLEKVASFDAHSDYIRSIAVHSAAPLVLTAGDDLVIKSWNWEKGWMNIQTFESHAHYVMMVAWNPRDHQLFASASLDRTIRIWSVPAPMANQYDRAVTSPHFTLLGHDKGVNSIEYSQSGDKPYLLSASDDCTVRVWDYQTRQCLQTLEGHSKNVCHAAFHPYLPLIMSVSEDGLLRVWNSSTYREETTLTYDCGRIWALATLKGSNDVAMATDEGTFVLSVGSEKPVASMHQGKVLFVKGVEIFSANVRMAEESLIVDGEKILLPFKEVGSSSVFPQSISHHPNGRLVSICGDGEYSVMTAQALRNKAYGQAYDLVWSPDGSFAVREEFGRVRIFSDFEEVQNFRPAYEVFEIYGGQLIGVRGEDFVCFYDWATARFIRRVDGNITGVYWSESGNLLAITTPEAFYTLTFNLAEVQAAIVANVPESDEGLSCAFEIMGECTTGVESAIWVEDCFIFVTSTLRLQTSVAGQTDTIAFLPRKQYLLGYVPDTSRFYLIDREGCVTSYKFNQAFLHFQSALASGDEQGALQALDSVPAELHERVARFFVHEGYKRRALEFTSDLDYKFDIAVSLGDLDLAAEQITAMEQANLKTVKSRWRSLGDAALKAGDFDVAKRAFRHGQDCKAQLLMATCLGDPDLLKEAQTNAINLSEHNVILAASLLSHDYDACMKVLKEERGSWSSAIFSRAYCPSRLVEATNDWIEEVRGRNALYASRIVVPEEENIDKYFPHLQSQKQLENLFYQYEEQHRRQAIKYKEWATFSDYDFVEELKDAGIDALKEAMECVETADEGDEDEDDNDAEEQEDSEARSDQEGEESGSNSSS